MRGQTNQGQSLLAREHLSETGFSYENMAFSNNVKPALYLLFVFGFLLSLSYGERHYDGRFRMPGKSYRSLAVRKPTKDLKEIFIGRCLYFGNVMYTNPLEYEPKNCTRLWEEFHSSYSGHNECNTPEQNYYPFVESAYNTVKENQSAFWEGLQIFMEEFSMNGKRFTGIANTLTGYVLNNCAWCGASSSENSASESIGQNSTRSAGSSCSFTWAPNCTEHSFWAAVSRQYAKSATGRVSLFLNAMRSSVYNKYGLFTSHELPQLYWPKNTHVDVKLVLQLGTLPTELCGTGSLLELQTEIERKNLTMTCTHYPLDVTHFMCVDNPKALECRLYYDHDCLMTVERGQEKTCAYQNGASFFTSSHLGLYLFVVILSFFTQKNT